MTESDSTQIRPIEYGRGFAQSPKHYLSFTPGFRDCVKTVGGCPRLVRGRFTLAARNEQQPTFEDATALRGGVSRCLLFVFWVGS